LNYDLVSNLIGDAFYGAPEKDSAVITFFGGKGFCREFHRMAIEKSASILTDLQGVADKFVTGTGRDLALGGFFNTIYLIDGQTVAVKQTSLFDHGKIAQAQLAEGYVHPETGFPMESYRGVAIDIDDADGQPNLRHVVQKDRAFLHGVIPGLTPAPKGMALMSGYSQVDNPGKAGLIVSEVDEGGYTRFRSCGVQLMKGTGCFDLRCTAGD
jgi:hypothetical protein